MSSNFINFSIEALLGNINASLTTAAATTTTASSATTTAHTPLEFDLTQLMATTKSQSTFNVASGVFCATSPLFNVSQLQQAPPPSSMPLLQQLPSLRPLLPQLPLPTKPPMLSSSSSTLCSQSTATLCLLPNFTAANNSSSQHFLTSLLPFHHQTQIQSQTFDKLCEQTFNSNNNDNNNNNSNSNAHIDQQLAVSNQQAVAVNQTVKERQVDFACCNVNSKDRKSKKGVYNCNDDCEIDVVTVVDDKKQENNKCDSFKCSLINCRSLKSKLSTTNAVTYNDNDDDIDIKKSTNVKPIVDSTLIINHKITVKREKKPRVRSKKHFCPICNLGLSNKGQLVSHIRSHTGERPFKCDNPFCNKAFTRNEELTRHKRIHTGNKPFACYICAKRFGRKDHLKKHTKTHMKRRMTANLNDTYFVDNPTKTKTITATTTSSNSFQQTNYMFM